MHGVGSELDPKHAAQTRKQRMRPEIPSLAAAKRCQSLLNTYTCTNRVRPRAGVRSANSMKDGQFVNPLTFLFVVSRLEALMEAALDLSLERIGPRPLPLLLPGSQM